MAEHIPMEGPEAAEGCDSLSNKKDGLDKPDIVSGAMNASGFQNLISKSKNEDNRKLSDIFKEGLNLYDNISESDEPTNSVETQVKVKRAMGVFEDITRMVSAAGLFSRNEKVEEIPTSSVRYLLLPALLGNLSLKLCVDDRIEVVRTAEVYFRDFLQRCKDYGVSDFEIPEQEDEASEELSNPSEPHKPCSFDLIAMARERNLKLQRYKEQKELESKIKELKAVMDSPSVSEEVEREFYLTLIKLYINLSFDDINSLTMEKRMLAHMARVKKDMPSDRPQRREKIKKPLMPIIITRDEVQKKVFGAGYPSLPTMTVAEFYDKKVKDGEFPDPEKPRPLNALQDRAPIGALGELADPSEEENAEKERKVEEDDPQTLQQAREWDEWKDDHRRGWGNRMNRS